MEPPARPSGRSDFHIAIICALPREADAVYLLCDHFYIDDDIDFGKDPGDSNMYTIATMGRHNVVIVTLPNMGTTSATSAAATLRISYPNIRIALIVGICGGVPVTEQKELYLGDVAISTLVVQYDSGRQYPDKFIVRSTIEDSNGRPTKEVRSILALLETEHNRKRLLVQATAQLKKLQEKAINEDYEANYQEPPNGSDVCYPANFLHKHHISDQGVCVCIQGDKVCPRATEDSCDTCGCHEAAGDLCRIAAPARPLKVILGRIGSANMVMKSGEDRDRLARDHKLVAFEMEASGVWDEIPSLTVKGICDYADSHKNKAWQHYAAAQAAAVARALVERLHIQDPPAAALSTQGSREKSRLNNGQHAPGSRTMSNMTIGSGGFVNQGDISGGSWNR
ncbi:nucleoside phosphorylase domain-containing protein [Plectosphaerella plurivora]|uniref:Nucleoside phosphorylase domain-containing protein n=1 Tax=Plectosphaerella plurivora TaxID=936078 RepID=A0A9P8VBJ9_9PEZI|nr:nucleoside phosphorylase domain-containing protein [Plectosphaerella plurivora]